MLKEVQVNKTEEKVYLLDENYDVFGVLPMSTDYYQDNGTAVMQRMVSIGIQCGTVLIILIMESLVQLTGIVT